MIPGSSLSFYGGGYLKPLATLLFTMTMILVVLSFTALAEVTEISVSPEDPSPGDTITVTGKASPNELVSASVSFQETQKVSDGTFAYSLSGVTIPDGSDSFGLVANGVDGLKIQVKVPILGYVSVPESLIGINGNVATFGTGKINSGTYDIKLSGSSPEEQVGLSFNARATITADENGDFVYTYSTDNIPEGDYSINIGGTPLSLDLRHTDDSSSSSPSSSDNRKSSGGSSRTGTDLEIVDAGSREDEGVDNSLNTVDQNVPEPSNNAVEENVPENYVEGYELSSEPSGIMDKLPDIGVTGLIVGILSLIVVFIGYRRNSYR